MFDHPLLPGLLALQDAILERVREARAKRPSEELARIVREEDDDCIFEIDRVAETDLVDLIASRFRGGGRIRITAEGLSEDVVLETGGPGRHHLILDPIDGSRLLAWDKRSAFILGAVAPDRDGEETLEDIELAVQTEIPCSRSSLSDRLVALRGGGTRGETLDLATSVRRSFRPQPSGASRPDGGFGSLVRFFAPGRELLARIDDALIAEIAPGDGRPLVFEDPYLSTGGLIHQIVTGRDRFAADLRPRIASRLEAEGKPVPLCAHPYDICTFLVAREAGAAVTSDRGGPLDQPLDRCGRVGYVIWANEALRQLMEKPLMRIAAEILGD